MRLAAVYFPNNCLPFIFGEQHEGFIINLGGAHFYNKVLKDDNLLIDRETNKHFIEDFWGESLSLISAVVGKNGIGKSSILRAIHYSHDKRKKDVLYIIEDHERVFIYNELDIKIQFNFHVEKLKGNAFDSVKKYYTPIVDVEQVNIFSDLNLVWDEQKNLIQLYLKQILQDVKLLNDPVIEEIFKVYPDFPQFKKLRISVSQHKKFTIKSVHGATNLGTQDRINVLTNYINKDISDLSEGNVGELISPQFVQQNYLERYIGIAKSTGLNSLYERLWELPEYKFEEEDKLHNGKDFLKNFEITLFTYLIIDATFPQTPFIGNYEFSNIVDFQSFEERFNGFMELYFENIYSIVVGNIKEKLERVNIEDYEAIKNIIQESGNSKFTQSGFKSSDAVSLMLRYLERFKAYYDLYSILKESIEQEKFEIHDGYFVYELNKHSEDDFAAIVDAYDKIEELSPGLVYTLDLLSIKLTYPLSSGEKALLSFFSRINNMVNKMRGQRHPIFDFHILLLDEAELGFHPIWKRKFVKALTKCLPVIYNKLTPDRNLFDDGKGVINDLNLQILFSTHDPLTLSDIPATNVIFIDRNEKESKSFIVERNIEVLKTFGANVHDILAESFFMKGSFMGEFVESRILSLIQYLTDEPLRGDNVDKYIWDEEKSKKFIALLDEPFLHERLKNLLDTKYHTSEKQSLLNQRNVINKRLMELDNEEN